MECVMSGKGSLRERLSIWRQFLYDGRNLPGE